MNSGGFLMTNVSIGVLSAAEFEKTRGLISELSVHTSYDDWLDWRYGMFMGLSLGGEARRARDGQPRSVPGMVRM